MSWPKTSTRPSSRVSSPQMRRMSVDLPEPLAPRTPWMSPRSRRIDTCEIAVTGVFFRPTTNRLLTSSIRRAGGPSGRLGAGWTCRSEPAAGVAVDGWSGRPAEPFFSCGSRMVVTGGSRKVRGGGWSGTTKAASSASRSVVGWASRLLVPAGPAVGRGRASKKPGARSGPRLWFVRKAVLPPAV